MNRSRISLLASLFCVLVIASCNTKTENPDPEDNFIYVSFEKDGNQVIFQDGVNNYGNGPGISTYPDSAGRLHSQFTTFIRSALDPDYENDILTIQMVRFFSDSSFVTYNTSFLMFDEGTYDYGSWNEDSTYFGIDGAVITYTDENGKIWSSDRLYGMQESWADFEVTEHMAVDEDQFGAKTKGNFNVRVFDGTGGFVDLRNANFQARTIFKD
ncbi:MAG: hypothetical protein RL266_2333 [Bacteroidota bacterium]|jgi:hypothetical protein